MAKANKPAKKKNVAKRPKTTSKPKRTAAPDPLPYPVVGIAAAAGGFDALKRFLQALGEAKNAAFVLVQHLDPAPNGSMAALLRKYTPMPVQQAREGMPVLRGHVYLNPPKKQLRIERGVLRLKDAAASRGRHRAVDHFLRSLANDQRDNGAAVILSGTGADGTVGVKAVKKAGGLVLVQTVEDAQHDGMPRSALSTNAVDYWGSVDELAQMLREALNNELVGTNEPGVHDEEILTILHLLKVRHHNDFGFYKRGTLIRRINRRVGLAQLSSIRAYRERLEEDEAELAQLSDDLLIGTTQFFRDPEAFEFLAAHVIPEICRRDPQSPVRIWVSGTATGEEAYSIAILVFEELERLKQATRAVQIFATDMNVEALEQAREGSYPLDISEDVSAERLEQFFTKEKGRYRVKKPLREALTFAVQNVITDPPFSRVELIVCRNVLIYLLPEVQKRILNLFHFALAEGGYLFMGPAESVSGRSELFKTIEKHHRIYQRLDRPRSRVIDFSAPAPVGASFRLGAASRLTDSVRLQGQKTLEEYYTPPAVLVSSSMDVVEIYGDISPFMRLQPGRPTMDAIELALPTLKPKLRSLMYQRRKRTDPEVSIATTFPDNESGAEIPVHLSARHLKAGDSGSEGYLIVFRVQSAGISRALASTDGEWAQEQAVRLLEEELTRTRDDLQSTIEQLETTNEELKASNEEVMSMNEEFQSTNEELETSKEELQSTNEELATVNSELEEKLQELERRTNDINNLLDSTEVGAIFLDREFRVQWYTPAVTALVNLIGSDIGRPFEDIAQRFKDDALMTDARTVLRTFQPSEREITGPEDRFYQRRILPYRTEDNRIEGVVITFVDLTERRRAELHRARLAAIVEGSDQAIIGKTLDGIVTSWNRGSEVIYGYAAEEVVGRCIDIIFPPEISHESMAPVYETLRAGKRVPPMETVRVRKDGTRLNMMVTISPIIGPGGEVAGVSTVATDVTERKRLESQLQILNAELEQRVAVRTREVEERAQKIRQLAMQMTRAEHNERRRIARILHDNIQQLHIAAKMRIEQARFDTSREGVQKLLNETADLLDQVTQASRTLTVELYPPVLAHSGVAAALEWLKHWMMEQYNFDVNLSVDGAAEPGSLDLGYIIFECAREMVLNVVKHSGVTKTDLSLAREGSMLHLNVRDEGNGCDPEPLAKLTPGSFGLASMRERLEFMGGRLEIQTAPGQGFCADAWFREETTGRAALGEPGDSGVRVHENTVVDGKIRAVVVDDHDVVRSGIVAVLEDADEVAVVGEASDGESGVRLSKMLQPDVVLMDINMPRLSGIDAARILTKECPTVAVVGLSVNDDARTIDDMHSAGAAAYVIKGAPAEELLAKIKNAVEIKRPAR